MEFTHNLSDYERILYTEKDISDICDRIAAEINRDYEGKNLMILCVLKGSCPFASDLLKRLTMPVQIDYIRASSYGRATTTSGVVNITCDTSADDLSDFDVIVIEDILDTGTTLMKLMEYMKAKNAKSVKLCALLNKYERNMKENNIHIDYEGAKIEDNFVVGYGLDYAENYRNLPFIAILKPEVYSK